MGISEETYQQLMDDFPDAVVVHDGQTILFANKEARRLSGGAPGVSLAGRPVLDFVSTAYHDQVKQRITEVTDHRTATPLVFERFLRFDGSEFLVEVKSMPIDFGGKAAVQIVARDCTQRIRAEEALAASEANLRALIREMRVGVVIHGLNTSVLVTNPMALELLGVTEAQLLGRTSFDPNWDVIHEDGSRFLGSDHPSATVLATGQAVCQVVMGVARPQRGDRVWLSVDAVPQHSADGLVRQVLVTFVDITERKQAEDRVKALLEENELILREVHHRIKNNMANIKAMLTLQADTLTDLHAREALEDAQNRIQSMMVLYDKLYRSADLGSLSVNDYLPALVRDILENFPQSRDVQVKFDIEDFTLAMAHLQPLGIIVNELITNVMKYAFVGRSGGLLSVSARAVNKRVTIAVQDDGNGLPPDVSFDNTSGFGLSLVAMLAKTLRGTIRIDGERRSRLVLEFGL